MVRASRLRRVVVVSARAAAYSCAAAARASRSRRGGRAAPAPGACFGLLPPGLLLPPAAAVARAEPLDRRLEFRRPLGRQREDVVGVVVSGGRRSRWWRAVRGEGRVVGSEVGETLSMFFFFELLTVMECCLA